MEFRQIYIEYQPKILRFLTHLTGEKVEAEDLTQEVFIKVHEALPGFEGRSSLSTWIYRIATNTANDHFKSPSIQKGSKQTLPREFLSENIENRNVWTGETEKTSDKVLETNEMNCCIKKYIDKLNENYKTVFILSEYEGKSNREIEDILGLSLETVKIRISRARKQLKKMMEKGCEISSEEGSLKCNEI